MSKIFNDVLNYCKDMKVLHGTMEIANQMNTITKGLKNKSIYAKTLNYYPSYLNYESDYCIDVNSFPDLNEANNYLIQRASEFIEKFNLFHFHFGTSLTLNNSDLPVLTKTGKKVIMQHWGSDVRLYSKAVKNNPYVKVKTMDEDSIKKSLSFFSRYISNCVVSDFELYEYVKDYYQNVFIIPPAVDLSEFNVTSQMDDDLLIVHAPTNPQVKGTEIILKAIEELKSKYKFEFKLIYGIPHKKAKSIYKRASLVIDQILIGSYGLVSIESMAAGKPVICWISDFMKERYPEELPIVSANPDNIKEKLEYLIKNRDILRELGRQGRSYVEKYHDVNIISEMVLKYYLSI